MTALTPQPPGSAPAAPLPGRSRTFPALSLPQLWVFLAVALPVVAALIAPLSTVDLAYNIRAGQLMFEQGTILRTDPFTFTVGGQPWLDQQWGAQIVLGGLYEVGGWALLAAVRALLVGLIFWFVYRSCREAGAGQRSGAWLTLAAFGVSAAALGMRPQLFGILLFAVAVWLVAGRRRDPRRLWLVPLLVLAWANLHGSFFLGPAILVYAWLDDRWRHAPHADRTLVVALVAGGASLLNPWGLGVWEYALGLSVSPTIRTLLAEWQLTTPLTAVGAVFYLSVVGAAVALVARRPRPIPWPALLWLGVLAAIGVYAERGVVWWAIGAPSVIAAILFAADAREGISDATGEATGGARATPPERRSILNGVIALAIVCVGIVALPWWRAAAPTEGPIPLVVDAATGMAATIDDRAAAGAGDRLFAPQPLGSWFELAAPDTPVFVDSRIELFPTAVWDDYLAVSTGAPGWQAILDRWGVTLVATSPDETGLTRAIRADPGWRVVYDGADGLVFART